MAENEFKYECETAGYSANNDTELLVFCNSVLASAEATGAEVMLAEATKRLLGLNQHKQDLADEVNRLRAALQHADGLLDEAAVCLLHYGDVKRNDTMRFAECSTALYSHLNEQISIVKRALQGSNTPKP